MAAAPNASGSQREPEPSGQTVVVIGGSAGIGLENGHANASSGPQPIHSFTDRRPPFTEKICSTYPFRS
jgi:hypothetical protein